MRRVLRSLALVLGLMAARAEAAEAPVFIALNLPSLFGTNGEGPYAQVHTRISELAGIEPQTMLLPPARAVAEFEAGRGLCLFPTSGSASKLERAVVGSAPINWFQLHIVAPPYQPLPRREELPGLLVGAILGIEHAYRSVLDMPGMNVEFSRDERTNLLKLMGGRLDAVLAIFPDARVAAEELGIELNYDPLQPLIVRDDAYVCADTEEGRAMAVRLSGLIEQMRASGELATLLGSSFMPPPAPAQPGTH
ncbi:amino acid ABC transporter substrate-binding protein [Indioceanicola profundi]|uniref:amino acid ABC transporter substrate-binding protein n=1 Tax=Indioceanicola profundi TaxID=2220096 RepID=UPI0013C51145|nr:amino acid ABC transporter substrate-binding protein [Indioceanicola profundi]